VRFSYLALVQDHVRFTGKCMLYSLCQLSPNSPLKSYPRVSEISLSCTFAGVRFYISFTQVWISKSLQEKTPHRTYHNCKRYFYIFYNTLWRNLLVFCLMTIKLRSYFYIFYNTLWRNLLVFCLMTIKLRSYFYIFYNTLWRNLLVFCPMTIKLRSYFYIFYNTLWRNLLVFCPMTIKLRSYFNIFHSCVNFNVFTRQNRQNFPHLWKISL
jgi:hypothetical protein